MRICTIGYVADAEEADRRMRRGEHQHCCRHCSRGYWPMHKEEHRLEHEPEPSGVEVTSRGTIRKVRARKRPCIDCPEAEAQWDRDLAASVRVVADFARRHAEPAP